VSFLFLLVLSPAFDEKIETREDDGKQPPSQGFFPREKNEVGWEPSSRRLETSHMSCANAQSVKERPTDN